MTVSELSKKLELEVIVMADKTREVTGGYVCDLLSWVMGRSNPGDAWITVIGNINTIAVSLLADTACVILAENCHLDNDAKLRAEIEGVTVLRSSKNSFQLACEIGTLIANSN
jgi:hypothetical protein